MLYLIINREKINEAINGNPEKEATSCPKTKILKIAYSIKDDEIILIWEDKVNDSFPLWVISDKVYLETLAYIDTYVKKYTPFTSFFRVISLRTFLHEGLEKKKTPIIDTDVLIGVVIAEAHLSYDRSSERENSLPIQAYLSTLSATIIYAINSGYPVEKISEIIENWEKARSLLSLENDEKRVIELLNFWIPVLSNLSGNDQISISIDRDDYLPENIQSFLFLFYRERKITKEIWRVLAGDNKKIFERYSDFSGNREKGIESLGSMVENFHTESNISAVEIEVILAASLSVISSGSIEYLSLALSFADRSPLVAHWYMLFAGMNEKKQVFSTVRGVGNHIRKHLSHNDSLFSKVTSDISYPELKVILTNKINIIPFITQYSTVIDVEIYPLVKAKYRINRNSSIVRNERKEGVFLKNSELVEVMRALAKANKILGEKSFRKK